ncbi:thymidylate synthase [Lampropedia puyangensis]|uniref:Thymidylate synthase n=1 Tax=Lampropedia puyangensis TaxID=1330072 RepID=A0A4S8EMY4_9BURK|nr:thymidylate synthase [Lampropedia puyangensis]THT95390.1 thymidylate synthase [Lampropedia puyangensis]
MKQYLQLVQDIFDNGSWQDNRTGVRTLSIPGAMMKFDLQEGFPAVTTKKLAFKSAIGEMVGFLRGSRSAETFRALGCKVWDQNANENAQWLANPYRLGQDDLGPVYGVQWRQWPAYKLIDTAAPEGAAQLQDALARGYQRIGEVNAPAASDANPTHTTTGTLLYKSIDQLRQCLDTIMKDPGSRRILFHGWNWAQLEEMALPPCHLLYQFLVNQSKREISLCLYIRSNDVGLGTPFNLTEGAALLHLVGRLTGYTPRWFTYFIGDAHIYENHVEMLQEQLRREPLPAPQLVLSSRIPDFAQTGQYEPQWLEQIEPGDFSLQGYQHHAHLTAPMAV